MERDPLLEDYPLYPEMLTDRRERIMARVARRSVDSFVVMTDWFRAAQDEEVIDDE